MTTAAPPPLACSVCSRKDAPNYFRVTKITAGTESHLTMVCSAVCLTKWVYAFTAMQGARLAYGAKNAWDQAREALGKLLGKKRS